MALSPLAALLAMCPHPALHRRIHQHVRGFQDQEAAANAVVGVAALNGCWAVTWCTKRPIILIACRLSGVALPATTKSCTCPAHRCRSHGTPDARSRGGVFGGGTGGTCCARYLVLYSTLRQRISRLPDGIAIIGNDRAERAHDADGVIVQLDRARQVRHAEIGRASCRERV